MKKQNAMDKMLHLHSFFDYTKKKTVDYLEEIPKDFIFFENGVQFSIYLKHKNILCVDYLSLNKIGAILFNYSWSVDDYLIERTVPYPYGSSFNFSLDRTLGLCQTKLDEQVMYFSNIPSILSTVYSNGFSLDFDSPDEQVLSGFFVPYIDFFDNGQNYGPPYVALNSSTLSVSSKHMTFDTFPIGGGINYNEVEIVVGLHIGNIIEHHWIMKQPPGAWTTMQESPHISQRIVDNIKLEFNKKTRVMSCHISLADNTLLFINRRYRAIFGGKTDYTLCTVTFEEGQFIFPLELMEAFVNISNRVATTLTDNDADQYFRLQYNPKSNECAVEFRKSQSDNWHLTGRWNAIPFPIKPLKRRYVEEIMKEIEEIERTPVYRRTNEDWEKHMKLLDFLNNHRKIAYINDRIE